MATPKKTATGRWWIQIEVAGVRQSGTFDSKTKAQAWAQRRATELRDAKATPPGERHTLRDALRDYADKVSPAKRGHDKELIRLRAFEGPAHAPLPLAKRVGAITAQDLAAWRDARLKINARGSVLRDMTLLSHVFETMRREWRCMESMRGFDAELVFGLKPQTLDALFRRARDRAGLAGFTFHDARHTAATAMAQRIHVLELCKVFGWKSTTRALTYFNPKMADLARRMAA